MSSAPSGVDVRRLVPADGPALGAFFEGLSSRTRATFAPHPLDRATADAIVAALAQPGARRLVAVADGVVVGYVLGLDGAGEHESARCAAAGYGVDDARAARIAPAVADAWQGRGLGGRLLRAVLADLRAAGRSQVLLLGGVQLHNAAAVHLYRRAGFVEVDRWEHPAGTWNADMVARLDG